MKTTLGGHQNNMSVESHLALHRTRTVDEGRGPHHSSHQKRATKGSAFNYTMHDCYEKLKQLVPTIPKNKKITRVEILQHVIDYIQDLQSALESHNINVRKQVLPGASRTPFTTLTPQQNLDMLSGLADLENCDWERTLLNLTSAARGTKLHPYETPESSPESLSACSSC